MRRRALLASLAASALPIVAGCTGDGTGTPTDEPTDTFAATDSPTPDEGTNTPTETDALDHSAQVTIDEVAVQRGYVEREVADAIGVVGDDRRYVWVDASVVAGAFAPDAFAFDTALEEFPPVTDARPYRFESDDESAYTLQSGSGWLLFELPLDVETPQQRHVPEMYVRWPEGTFEIERAVAERIATPPPSLSVTIEKRFAETPTTPIAVKVTNEGDVDGQFVGALNRTGPMVAVTPVQRVAVDVPAGETRTVTIEDDWSDRTPQGTRTDDGPAVEYDLNWAGGSASASFDEG